MKRFLLGFILLCPVAFTKSEFKLNISLVVVGVEWQENEINQLVQQARLALSYCRINFDQVETKVLERSEPDYETQSLLTSPFYILAIDEAQAKYTPVVYLTDNQGPAVGVAIRHNTLSSVRSKDENEKLSNTIWIRWKFWREMGAHKLVLAHELGHLLGLEHSEQPENIMFGDPVTDGFELPTFTKKQCHKLRKSNLLNKL